MGLPPVFVKYITVTNKAILKNILLQPVTPENKGFCYVLSALVIHSVSIFYLFHKIYSWYMQIIFLKFDTNSMKDFHVIPH